MRRVLAAVAGMAGMAACAQVDDQALAKLQPGRTTVEQAKAALGSPEREEVLADGSRMLTYVGSSAHTKPANFIPGAVYVWGGWNVTSNEAGLMFDKDGLLRFWAWSSNQRPRIKVVGKDAVPHAPDLELGKQNPLPEAGKGALHPDSHQAN